MRCDGDLIVFESGVKVVLLDSPNAGNVWNVILVQGSNEIPTGVKTWMSEENLSRGEKIDLSEFDAAMDALHEAWATAGSMSDSLAARVEGVLP